LLFCYKQKKQKIFIVTLVYFLAIQIAIGLLQRGCREYYQEFSETSKHI